jgi:hypothetical protein
MCEDDKYEQDKFQKWNQHLADNTMIDEQDTDDNETDSDQDDDQVYSPNDISSHSHFLFPGITSSQESKLSIFGSEAYPTISS